MDLGQEVFLPQQREQDVVEVDRQNVEEATRAGRVDGVAGVVSCCPGVGPIWPNVKKLFLSVNHGFS